MRIITAGRKDLDDLFRISGILSHSKLNHTPFLAFVETGDAVEVRIINSAKAVLSLPDNTPLMVQWRGEWRSDFFQMTVADVRRAMEAKP